MEKFIEVCSNLRGEGLLKYSLVNRLLRLRISLTEALGRIKN